MITKALEDEAIVLTKEIEGLEAKKSRLGLINQLLQSYRSEQQPELFQKVTGENTKFATVESLTDAVLRFLGDNRQYHQPIEIRDALLSGGFKNDSPNLIQMITSICKRKTAAGYMIKGEKNGHNAYMAV